MKRWWVSWWTSQDRVPGFTAWISGARFTAEGTQQSMCALVDAPSEDVVWQMVADYYPDYEQRFCNERTGDWKPGDRFS